MNIRFINLNQIDILILITKESKKIHSRNHRNATVIEHSIDIDNHSRGA